MRACEHFVRVAALVINKYRYNYMEAIVVAKVEGIDDFGAEIILCLCDPSDPTNEYISFGPYSCKIGHGVTHSALVVDFEGVPLE